MTNIIGVVALTVSCAYGYTYGVSAKGGYSAANKSADITDSQLVVGNIHGQVGVNSYRWLFQLLGDGGVKSSNRFYSNIGSGVYYASDIGIWGMAAYGAVEFGDKATLYGSTLALNWMKGNLSVDIHGYLPIGKSSIVTKNENTPVYIKEGNKLKQGTENSVFYDSALMGGDSMMWYNMDTRWGPVSMGGGMYYLKETRGESAQGLGVTLHTLVGPQIQAKWWMPVSKHIRMTISGQYRYDNTLKNQVGITAGISFGETDLSTIRYGVPSLSLLSRNANPNKPNPNPPKPPPNPPKPPKDYHIVHNYAELQEALRQHELKIYIEGDFDVPNNITIPDDSIVCSGMCSFGIVYDELGNRFTNLPNSTLRFPTAKGTGITLEANTTLRDLNISMNTATDWTTAITVDSTKKDLGIITLDDITVHGIVSLVQNIAGSTVTYSITKLSIVQKDAWKHGWPTKAIPNQPIPSHPTQRFHQFYGSAESMALVTIGTLQHAGVVNISTLTVTAADFGTWNHMLFRYTGYGTIGKVDLTKWTITKKEQSSEKIPLVIVSSSDNFQANTADLINNVVHTDASKVIIKEFDMPDISEVYIVNGVGNGDDHSVVSPFVVSGAKITNLNWNSTNTHYILITHGNSIDGFFTISQGEIKNINVSRKLRFDTGGANNMVLLHFNQLELTNTKMHFTGFDTFTGPTDNGWGWLPVILYMTNITYTGTPKITIDYFGGMDFDSMTIFMVGAGVPTPGNTIPTANIPDKSVQIGHVNLTNPPLVPMPTIEDPHNKVCYLNGGGTPAC